MSDEELQTMLQASALTGIPAATLAGLRDGSLVAVPREPTEAEWKQVAIYVDRDPDGGFLKNARVAWPLLVSATSKLAAAQDRTP